MFLLVRPAILIAIVAAFQLQAATIDVLTGPSAHADVACPPYNTAGCHPKEFEGNSNSTANGQEVGTIYNVQSIPSYSTFGNPTGTQHGMAGMVITATWLDNAFPAAQCIWANGVACLATSAGSVNLFQVSIVDDTSAAATGTFNGLWTIKNLRNTSGLATITFNGVPGNTVFDRSKGTVYDPANCGGNGSGLACFTGVGTTGSNVGWDAAGSNNNGNQTTGTLTGTAVYKNQVKLFSDATPFGDEYATVQISFNGNGLLAGAIGASTTNAATFRMDTDNFAQPEPSTFILLGSSLILVAAARFRAKR
jgi:hypothetical protein